jgi:hypothetical protein
MPFSRIVAPQDRTEPNENWYLETFMNDIDYRSQYE